VKVFDTDSDIYNIHEYGLSTVTREIFLHSHVYPELGIEEPGMDFRMANQFVKNIRVLDQMGTSSILIHQMSVGGDWNYGMAIYDAIKACVSSVTILAYAHARSMSSVTLQAADRRVLMPDCDFLIHHGAWAMDDRVTAVVSNIEHTKKVETPRMMQVYAERCASAPMWEGCKRKEIVSYIMEMIDHKSDWIMTAKEAVKHGFADGVFGEPGFETMQGIRG
jgi:ATP-dependent protease ClpP protease subunit